MVSFTKGIKSTISSIGKGVANTGRRVGKAVTSKKFIKGAKIAAAVAAAAALTYAGVKTKQKYDASKKSIGEAVQEVQDVKNVVKSVKKGVKEVKKRKSNVDDAIQEFKQPGYTRESQQESQKKAGAALAKLGETLKAPTATSIQDKVSAVLNVGDKKTAKQKDAANKEREKIISEIRERKKKLNTAEQNNVVTNVVNSILGNEPSITGEYNKKKAKAGRPSIAEQESDSGLSQRIFGWFGLPTADDYDL